MVPRHWCPTMVELERDPDGPTLNIGHVAAILGLSREIVRGMIDAGDIRSFRVGRNYKILWCSFRTYLFQSGALPLAPAERRLLTADLRPNLTS